MKKKTPEFQPRAELVLDPCKAIKLTPPNPLTSHDKWLFHPLRLRELIWSPTLAYREKPDNILPGPEILSNLTWLCQTFLHPFMTRVPGVQIKMGWVPPAHAPALGLSETSDHCLGYAVDITCADRTLSQLTDALIHQHGMAYNAMVVEGAHVHVRAAQHLPPTRKVHK